MALNDSSFSSQWLSPLRLCLAWGAGLVLATSVVVAAGLPLPERTDTSLLLRGDNSLSGVAGEAAISSQGVSYVAGVAGQAIRFGASGYAMYATSANLSASAGSVEFWIRPRWDGNTNTTRVFLRAGHAFDRGMLLALDGANNLRFIQWGDDPATGTVETNVERGVGASGAHLRSGVWYHIAVTWSAATGEMAYYLDGELKGSLSNAVSISNFSTSQFSLGAESNGSSPSSADFDELRFSNVALSQGLIAQSYQAGRGVAILAGPRGMATFTDGGSVLAETDAHQLRRYSADGALLGIISSPINFSRPTDVATNGSNRIYIADTGNHRVLALTRSGTSVWSTGSLGTAAGQLNAPQGVCYHAGALYVADTGNHRIQRYTAQGVLDTAWATGGVLGTTGGLQRDHTGFDQPRDVAVSPLDGRLYVADYGNCRLEVFEPSGVYVRTILAVYRPNALAFDASGNLYVAGDDPAGGVFPAWDGHLRVLRPGNSLLSAFYTGGLDDLGRIQGGVAFDAGSGAVLFTDVLQGRVVEIDTGLKPPASDLRVQALGSTVKISWRTVQAQPTRLSYGATGTEQEYFSATPTDTHQAVLEGLTPGTLLRYSVGLYSRFDNSVRYLDSDVINTGVAAGQHQFLRIKAAAMIYKDTQAGTGYTGMSAAQLAQARARIHTVAEFYWRNSGCRLWIDATLIEVSRDVTDGPQFSASDATLEADLTAAGYSVADSFDAVYATCTFMDGNYGGGSTIFGRHVGKCRWTTQTDFVALHEISHTFDSIYDANGLPKYEFNHGIWAVGGGVGGDVATNGQVLRNFLPANYTAVSAPYTKIMLAADADADGLPDSSPVGLTNPLPLHEALLGTSTSDSDSDDDFLSDFAEATALIGSGTSPLAQDSDGDGTRDDLDFNPGYRISDHVVKASPVINGQIGTSEGWTTLSSAWGVSNTKLVTDTNTLQALCTTYVAWDDTNLYLAMRGPGALSDIRLSGSATNWFLGSDSYHLTFHNNTGAKTVRINVGVPDLFRQIDDRGEFGEFFDTDTLFARPYNGSAFYASAVYGAGFTGRLVTEANITMTRGGSGNNQVWEAAIPWSDVTGLRGYAGKVMALSWVIGGDALFDTDHAARLRLVETVDTVGIDRVPTATASTYGLRFFGYTGVPYQVWYSHDLSQWFLASNLQGNNAPLTFIDDGSQTGNAPNLVRRRFYRVTR